MRVRGIFLVLLALLSASFALAASSDAGPFTAGPGSVRNLETGAAGLYTVEFDLTAGQMRDGRMMVLATFFGESSGKLIGQLGILNDGRAVMISHTDYGSTSWEVYDEGPKPRWNLGRGETAHIKVTIDAGADTIRYELEGLNPYQTRVGSGTATIAAQGLRTEFGFARDHADGSEQVPTGWVYRNMVVAGGGEPLPPGTGGGDTGGDPTTPATGATGSWRSNTQDGSGFEPEASDPESFTLYEQTGSFTPQDCGGARIWCPPSVLIANITNNQSLEKLTVGVDMVIDDVLPANSFTPTIWVSRTCSDKQIGYVDLRMPSEGMLILSSRGLTHLPTGQLALSPGTYHLEYVLDLADEETYAIISQGGSPILTVGARINSDATNPVTPEQLAGDLTVGIGWYRDVPGQNYFRPLGWTFSGLKVEGVEAGASYNQTGPDGADFSSDDGRLAFLAATLASAAANEGGRAVLDCGPANEVLITPPGEEPADAGDRYCALVMGDEDVAFGTFGVGSQGGNSTIEAAVLETYQDAQYALQLEETDIDPSACDRVDTTLAAFQECPDAVAGMRTYAYYHTQTGTVFLIVSRSRIDAFDTTLLERIGAFFRDLFGISEASAEATTSIPLRRFHHLFALNDENRLVMATWLDREASFSYRGFVTVLNETVPEDGTYRIGDRTQLITIPLDPDKSADVDRWRRMTAALRLSAVAGDPFRGDTCGNGIVGLSEQCEESSACSVLNPRWDENTTLPCTQCRYDVTACVPAGSVNGSCDDPWIPIEYPQPCGAAYTPEPGDEVGCPTSRPGSGGGRGGGGGGGGSGGPGDPAGPACPASGTVVATQGVYDFVIEYDSPAQPDGLLRIVPRTSFDTCVDDDVDVDLSFGPFAPTVLSPLLVYHRHKPGYETKIWLSTDGEQWMITGDDSVSAYQGDPGEGIGECWKCASTNASYTYDVFCAGLNITIPFCTPPGYVPPASTGTATSCTQIGDACSSSAQCCNNNACVDNLCAHTCLGAGITCTSNSNCCSDSCVSGVCEGGVGGGDDPDGVPEKKPDPNLV